MSSFFHTLVVVGAGLTVANCGGKARGEEDGPGSGGTGNAGTSGGNGGRATGGTSSAGTIGAGGTVIIVAGGTGMGGVSFGGTPSYGGAGGGVPWAGMGGLPVTRWSCDPESFSCNSAALGDVYVSAVTLDPARCTVDPSRPTSPADCGPGERFQCVMGTLEAEQSVLLVNCACSGVDAGAACICPGQFNGCIQGSSEVCTDEYSLCGCAWTCILI